MAHEVTISPAPDSLFEARKRILHATKGGNFVDFNGLQPGAKQAAFSLAEERKRHITIENGRTVIKERKPTLTAYIVNAFLLR